MKFNEDFPMGIPRRGPVSLESLDTRVTALEGLVETVRLDMANAVREIQANTALTEDIHGNTADIVEVMQDVKVLVKWGKRLARPVAYVFAFGIAISVFYKTGKWVWP
jgi:hypothetical protein